MDNVSERKRLIRKEMLSLRRALSMENYIKTNNDIQTLFNSMAFNRRALNYMSYVNIGKEVNTRNIIERLLLDGKNVSVPVCIPETTRLKASQIYDFSDLESSQFGLLEPKSGLIREVNPKDIEIVLVPGLAFDRKGNRLGYGKGYYDGFLIELTSGALKIGLSYSFQIIEEVPVDDFDIPLDIIVTEKEVIQV